MIFHHTAQFLKLLIGSIALSTGIVACNSNSKSSMDPAATPTATMNHNGMNDNGMNQGAMKGEGISHSMDLGPADADYDLRFIDAMIPHHEGAVVMAKDLAQKTKRPELQKLAKEIIASQQTEIDQMQQWQKSWYKK